MLNSIDLARYVVERCRSKNREISNFQLQKIMYLIQEKSLEERGKPAFEEDFEAWQCGPVLAWVYYHFLRFGAMPITEVLECEKIEDDLIDNVVDKWSGVSPWVLVSETNRRSGAWHKAHEKNLNGSVPIDVESIKGCIQK